MCPDTYGPKTDHSFRDLTLIGGHRLKNFACLEYIRSLRVCEARFITPWLALFFINGVAPGSYAEVGRAYLNIPGVDGDWKGAQFENWIRIEGRYWGEDAPTPGRGTGSATAQAIYSLPSAPYQGAGDLVFALRKSSPVLGQLMEQCAKRATLDQMTIAESADDFRNSALELGERPASIPEFLRYRLTGLQFKDCPAASAAPEQAFILSFSTIEWLNYNPENAEISEQSYYTRAGLKGEKLPLQPARFDSSRSGGEIKTFVVNWLGYAHDVAENQCPVMNSKPTPGNFEPPPVPGDKANDPGEQNRQIAVKLARRGPGFTNVGLLPGVGTNHGNIQPQTLRAHGVDLDNHDGTGEPAPGTCRQPDYQSPDGRTGIDNQLYRVFGCVAGLQGKQGLWMQVLNEEWRSGAISLLIQVSGIDDYSNDDEVEITFLYSEDDPVKDISGKEVLPDYSFRLSDKVEHTHYFTRVPARIVDGVILSRQALPLSINMVKGPALHLEQAQLRLELSEEGNLGGFIAGYQDWRYLVNYYSFAGFEVTFGYQLPAIYSALSNAADGMLDPESGECKGISTVYEIEAVPAFIPESEQALLATMVKPAQAGDK